MYSEEQIDWNFFRDIRDRMLVNYRRPDFMILAVKTTGLKCEDVEKRWIQLMYFFATIKLLSKSGTLLPSNKPIQPPPKLALIWKCFCKQMPDHATDFCLTFFEGQNLLWRKAYQDKHKLNPVNHSLILETAGRDMIGFDIDQELWSL
ncbi:MAG: hypothetical protein P1P90_05535 [Patescibacteria group bacterium]|nr:hypothetical protein [Patescibacteria group bacterium]